MHPGLTDTQTDTSLHWRHAGCLFLVNNLELWMLHRLNMESDSNFLRQERKNRAFAYVQLIRLFASFPATGTHSYVQSLPLTYFIWYYCFTNFGLIQMRYCLKWSHEKVSGRAKILRFFFFSVIRFSILDGKCLSSFKRNAIPFVCIPFAYSLLSYLEGRGNFDMKSSNSKKNIQKLLDDHSQSSSKLRYQLFF